MILPSSINDNSANLGSVDAAIARVLDIPRQQAPHAVPIVVGAFDPVPSQTYGTHGVDVARHVGDPQSIGTTRYTIAYMCAFEVSSDWATPRTMGTTLSGTWVAWHIQNGLDNGAPLHFTGNFWTV